MEDWREGLIGHLESAGQAGLHQWAESVRDDEALASTLFRARLQADMGGQLFVRAIEVPEAQPFTPAAYGEAPLPEPSPEPQTLEAVERALSNKAKPSRRVLQDADSRPSFLRMTFEEALDSFLARGVVTRAQYREMSDLARRDSFSAVKLTSEQIVARARDLIQAHIADGGSVASFTEGMRAGDVTLGIEPASPAYLENVMRTNTQSAYGAGRLRQLSSPDVSSARPYVEYRTAGDSRVRPNHAALEGVIFNRAEDPGWAAYAPPLGYQCRCSIRTLRASQVNQSKVKHSSELGADAQPDAGFAGPGAGATASPPPPKAPPPAPPVNVPRTREDMAASIARAVALQLGDQPDFPGEDRIRDNWHARLGDAEPSAAAVDRVEAAMRTNAENPTFRRLVNRFGQPEVVVATPVEGLVAGRSEAASAHIRGVTLVYDRPSSSGDAEIEARVRQRIRDFEEDGPRPGDPVIHGEAALLRHEAGHHAFHQLTPTERSRWERLLPAQERVTAGLTGYAGQTGAASWQGDWREESFSEAVALATHPNLDRSRYDADILAMVDFIHGLGDE